MPQEEQPKRQPLFNGISIYKWKPDQESLAKALQGFIDPKSGRYREVPSLPKLPISFGQR